jgi:ketol-acid reductoisomerase
LRDSGLNVIIGNRDDIYKTRAKNDGFETFSISEAVKRADCIFILIPDEIMDDIYKSKIKPCLKEHQVLIFASGYNIAFGLIKPPNFIDIILIAPRMIGIGVRECFLNQTGYYSFIGVHQNTSGNAKKILLGLCLALGTLKKGCIETSFKEEAVLDLFTEQGYGPPFGMFMMQTINTLTNAGYPLEAVLVELILSGQMKYLYEKISKYGISEYFLTFPERMQYGFLSRAIKIEDVAKKVFDLQKEVLKQIENGGFAEEWEKGFTKLKFKIIKFFASKIGFGKREKTVRNKLNIPEYGFFADIPYPSNEDIKKEQKIENQLEDFEDFPEY